MKIDDIGYTTDLKGTIYRWIREENK